MARRNDAVPKGPFHVAPIFASKAEGATLTDVEGKTYIDFCGGIGVQNVGHNHPKVVAAIKAQLEKFTHTCFHVAPYESYISLAERLNTLAPIDGPTKTAFFNSGAEAVENAIKIARAHTKRQAIIAFERGFHGRTLLAMSLTGKCTPYTVGFGPFAPEIYRLPYEPFFAPADLPDEIIEKECRAALSHLDSYHIDTSAMAALIVEPVLGEGGFIPIHPAAFKTLRKWTESKNILLIADEVQTGFARTGALFACERYQIKPDLMTMAKSMAAGAILSAVTGKADIMESPGVGGLGGTYGGNPVSCAAALAVLDVIEEEQLSDRAIEIGTTIMETFDPLAKRYDFIGSARGLGAMCGLEFINSKTGAPDVDRVKRICHEALKNGLLLMSASGNTLRTLMPLTISNEELRHGLSILSDAVESTR